MDKLLFKRIIIGVLSVLIVAYVVYLIFSNSIAKTVDVEEAVSTTVYDVINTDGFIIKNEKYITNDDDGVLAFNVLDGEDISAGQVIADIYNNEKDAVSRQQIKAIDEQIDSLRSLSETYYKDSISLETANSNIDNSLYSIIDNVNNGNFSDAKTESRELLLSICERQMITGNVRDFSAKISQLESRKSELESGCGESLGSVTSDKSGYFVSSVDGYENTFDYSEVDKLSLDDLKKPKKSKVPSNVVGKVITEPDWYIACKVSGDDTVTLAKLLNSGETIYVNMPSVTTEKIPVKIHSINQKSKQDDGVLVLTCDYMSGNISDIRSEKVEITTISYSGLKVAKRAIHEDYVTKITKDKKGNKSVDKKKVQGVYVLHGSELRFKEICISYSGSDFVLCNPNPEEGRLFADETLLLYDQVVIKGDNLYDGKIIN